MHRRVPAIGGPTRLPRFLPAYLGLSVGSHSTLYSGVAACSRSVRHVSGVVVGPDVGIVVLGTIYLTWLSPLLYPVNAEFGLWFWSRGSGNGLKIWVAPRPLRVNKHTSTYECVRFERSGYRHGHSYPRGGRCY